jgi:DNA ligase-1
MTYPTLYKRGSKGEVRTWRMEFQQVEEPEILGQHRVVTGILDGTMTPSGWTTCEPKNGGKKNATCSTSQALAEIDYLYKKKRDRGYFDDIEEIDNVPFTKPMLATSWPNRKDKIDFEAGVVAQPKLDGMRCLARADGIWSRSGQPLPLACKHIHEALVDFFEENPDVILDGEIYNHEFRDNFDQIMKLARKKKPTEEDLVQSRELMQYHLYDVISDNDAKTRQRELTSYFGFPAEGVIRVVPTEYVDSEMELDSLYDWWIDQGYEGQMIRINAPYDHKRSNNLIKRKEFFTEEYKVLRAEEGNGNWAGCVKRFVFEMPGGQKTKNGQDPEAGVRGTQEVLRELWESGKTPDWCTVRHLGLTPHGVPRGPVVVDYGFGERTD